MFVDLRQYTQLDRFNFLQNEQIVVMSPIDWTDDELKEIVWDNMIPHTSVESGPNEDVRFQRTCHLSPRLAIMEASAEGDMD